MQTLLPTRDQFPLRSPQLRDPISPPKRTTQPEAKSYSQFIKDQQGSDLRETSLKNAENYTSNINELRESKLQSIDRKELDSPYRFDNTTEEEKLEGKITDKSSAIVDDVQDLKSQDSHAQNQTDAAQNGAVESAETIRGDVIVESKDQSIPEDFGQGYEDSGNVIHLENFELLPSSDDELLKEKDSSSVHTVDKSEEPVEIELQTSLPNEPLTSADAPIEENSSTLNTDVKLSASSHTLSQSVSQEYVSEVNAKIVNQAQSQSTQQSADSNLEASIQIIDNNSTREKQEASTTQIPAQQNTSASNNNVPLEDQAVKFDHRVSKQSNSPTTVQATSQANQAARVTIGQDQQQSSTQDQPSSGNSQPGADEPKIKSSSNQQAKLNLPQTQEATSSHSAASARAVQIESAIRVENATGQPVEIQSHAKAAVQLISSSVSAINGAEGQPLSLPNSSADPLQDPAHARILRGLTATMNQRGGVLTMRLDPPDLGQLRIQMSIVRGIVTANFQVQTSQAQALLERSLATLRSALQGQGLTVERLTVQTMPQNTQGARYESDQQTSQQRQQHDASQGESKGRRDEQSQNSMSYKPQFPLNEYAAFDLQPQPAGAD